MERTLALRRQSQADKIQKMNWYNIPSSVLIEPYITHMSTQETKEEDGWEEEGGGEGNVEVEVEVEGEEEDGDGWEEEGEADGKGKAEGEGEGEESSPMFVPTKGVFFQHDVRYMSGDDKEQEKR